MCMRNVSRPVSYDECHTLSEQADDVASRVVAPAVLTAGIGSSEALAEHAVQGDNLTAGKAHESPGNN